MMEATILQHSPHQDGEGEPDENNDEERPEGITEKGIHKGTMGYSASNRYVVIAATTTWQYPLRARGPNLVRIANDDSS